MKYVAIKMVTKNVVILELVLVVQYKSFVSYTNSVCDTICNKVHSTNVSYKTFVTARVENSLVWRLLETEHTIEIL